MSYTSPFFPPLLPDTEIFKTSEADWYHTFNTTQIGLSWKYQVKHKTSFESNWNIEEKKNAVPIQICKVYALPSALNNAEAQTIIFIWLKIQFSTEKQCCL